MKIVHVVCTNAFAGVERYITLVAPRLALRGCDITVIGGDHLLMHRTSENVRWLPASTTWSATTQLARLGKMDIVHSHMTAADGAAVISKPLHRSHLVATLHFASSRGSSRTRAPLRLLGRFMEEQIAISDFVADATPATRTLRNGVEVADPGPWLRDPTILMMQRLETEKETEVALRAWSQCQLRRKGWRLIIAGRGSQLSELQRLSAALNVTESVEWVGFVDSPSQMLSRAGLLLATARAEPFGLSVVEAMARATPVIAAEGGAHREILGAAGWLFPPGDVEACVELIDDAENRDLASYGAHLRSRQQSLFDIEAHTDGLLEIYREVLG
jgi:glycosyltransferase involved in cell wall biosynthesis